MPESTVTDILKESHVTDIHLAVQDRIGVHEPSELKHYGKTMLEVLDTDRYFTNVPDAASTGVPDTLQLRQAGLDFFLSKARFRLRCHLSVYGPHAYSCLSIRRAFRVVPDWMDPGLPDEALRFFDRTPGQVPVADPVGSGKSRTLAAGVGYINRSRNAHILILEDPVEYQVPSRRSRVVKKQREDSFPGPAAAFAGSGREDPGILVTGQIRSNAMMQAVLYDVNARGLVLAGLHAAGSRQALDQVVGFYAQQDQDEARHLLVLSLTAILSQWLIRPQEGQIMQHWILRQPVGQGRLSAEAAEGLAHDREQLKQALLQTGER